MTFSITQLSEVLHRTSGGWVWHGRTAMRISVSSWATTEGDVERSLEAVIRVATNESSR